MLYVVSRPMYRLLKHTLLFRKIWGILPRKFFMDTLRHSVAFWRAIYKLKSEFLASQDEQF